MPMKDFEQQSKTIRLKEYKKPDFLIDQVELRFELDEEQTRVHSVLQVIRNASDESAPLILMGECLTLGEIKIDGTSLDKSAYEVTDNTLNIPGLSNSFSLEIERRLSKNHVFS